MQEYIYAPKKIYYRLNKFELNRPTLVFIHGLSGSSSAWRLYEEKFKNKFNVLTFDLRGHGNSAKWKDFEDYAIGEFSNDLFDLLVFLKINRFILVSHSFGVLVALGFMTRHIELLEKVIFLSPHYAPGQISAAKLVKPFLSLVNIFKILPFNSSGRGQVEYSRFVNTGDWNLPRMIADINKTSLRVYLFSTRQSYNVDYKKLLDNFKIPVLIMHGKKDTIFPHSDALEMSQKIPKASLISLDKADHILVLNYFSEVSSAIEKFVNSN